MKKILVIVLTGAIAIMSSCAKKIEEKPVFHFYSSAIFLPKLLVATAD